MEATLTIPTTLEERLPLGSELRVPASWEEFLDLLEVCDYRIQYDDGEIISFLDVEANEQNKTMGYASELHELLVGKIIRLLGNCLNEDFFNVFGSNLALHVPGLAQQYCNADSTVVRGNSEKIMLRGDMYAVTNPVLIVEVLSFSTRNYDLGQKFRNYRKVPSLQQVIFIESSEVYVASHVRQNGGGSWLLNEFSKKTDQVEVLGEGSFTLEKLYKNIDFQVKR